MENSIHRQVVKGDLGNFGPVSQDGRISSKETLGASRPSWWQRCAIALGCLALWGCVTTKKKAVELPPEPRPSRFLSSATALPAVLQYRLRWDRPYPERPENRYEIWCSTNLFTTNKPDWMLYTNTRYGEFVLDVTQFPVGFFVARTAIYETNADGSVNWDAVQYSDWARRTN